MKGLLNGALHRVVSEAGRISTLARLGRSGEALLRDRRVQWVEDVRCPVVIIRVKSSSTVCHQDRKVFVDWSKACSNRMIMPRAMHGCQGGSQVHQCLLVETIKLDIVGVRTTEGYNSAPTK